MHETVGSVHVKHIYEIAKVLFAVFGVYVGVCWGFWIGLRGVCVFVCVWIDRQVVCGLPAMQCHIPPNTPHHTLPPAIKKQKRQVKQKDYHLSHLPLRSLCRMVFGTCGTMGLKVDGLKEPAPVGE